MADIRNPNITDAATFIAAVQALDMGDRSAVPVWQQLHLSEEEYRQACRWLEKNIVPPVNSMRTVQTIALIPPIITRDDADCMLTLRLPLAHHLAFVSRVNNVICAQISALQSHNPAYAAFGQDIIFRDNFPLGYEPGVETTTRFDACCYLVQEPVIPVVLAVAEAGDHKQLEDLLHRVFERGANVRMLVVFQLQKQGEGMGAMVEQYLRVEKTAESDHQQSKLIENVMVFRDPDGTFPRMPGFRKGHAQDQSTKPLENNMKKKQALTLPMPLFRGTNDSKELFPCWDEDITIPLGHLYQMLSEEEFQLKYETAEERELVHSWEIVEAEPIENQNSQVASPQCDEDTTSWHILDDAVVL